MIDLDFNLETAIPIPLLTLSPVLMKITSTSPLDRRQLLETEIRAEIADVDGEVDDHSLSFLLLALALRCI